MTTLILPVIGLACLPGTSFHLPGSGQSAGADESRGAGDNLVGPFLPTAGAGPALLVDWPKSPVSRAVFRGYTLSGMSPPCPGPQAVPEARTPAPPCVLHLPLDWRTSAAALKGCVWPTVLRVP